VDEFAGAGDLMPGPIRILHLANSLSDRGNGIVNVAVDLAAEQARRGQSVMFASEGGGFSELLESFGAKCVLLPQKGMRRLIGNSLGMLRLLRKVRPSVIHVHMRSGLVLAWPWARLLRIPVIMHLHNVHDPISGIARMPDRIIAVSEAVKKELLSQRIPGARIRVVLNGTLGSPRRNQAQPASAALLHPAFVTVSGLMHRKGIAELIEAFAKVASSDPAVHLYIVGSGTELELFSRMARESGTGDRIHFEGFHADPRGYLRAADIFVIASRRESFGLAILEAREAGCAIIATQVDGIPELLDRGRCGFLVPPRDARAMADAMVKLLQDSVLRKSLRGEARVGLERFTVERMVDEVMAVYQELLAE
jgi:glycosyltransferase involved in cell wall biosynthesis